MEKFRVISDIHIDVNDKYPFTLDDDIFTIICGDTSGTPIESIKWIKKNIKTGVGVSGNHLPYNDEKKTIQSMREELAKAFPLNNDFTYLDVETGCFSKEVDGIIFLGSCFYSNMKIKSPYNPDGDVTNNKLASHRHMNDYRWGIKSIEYHLGLDNDPTITYITPQDYVEWSERALNQFDLILNENEKLLTPKPVVLITHYPLIKSIIANSFYVDDDNWASYGNDLEDWVKSHKSIKCHCCGHCHDMHKDYRNFYITRDDGTKILVVNNSRGYMFKAHDATFNPNRFVNTKTWEIEEIPESKSIIDEKEQRYKKLIGMLGCFF